ncbi:hypothetical protein ABID82_005036 [Methylobacterium sp. PvP062]|uniref:Uncharacterized protein n=1 Tax=Methylobacterium radiotolerans TaxID=31998 RepID=A0ABV2NTY7_9HYPH|nr:MULTISPECIES: hypothetical protein [unclassified Methylobacterium]MBP2498350.1 hypothetical protein [Methylobacterium sp. PvP105]MBP2505734.1 hypothetical protein [Methylobacterium sp. PvP109]
MKPYGRRRGDSGCCPGHDTFPSETYANRRSKRAQTRDTVLQHQRARAQQKHETRAALEDPERCQ